jgi:hypothetical protein
LNRSLGRPSLPAKPRLPDLILIDGGKGQLNAACHELANSGCQHIPVIGLAKEFEEIHRPGEKTRSASASTARPSSSSNACATKPIGSPTPSTPSFALKKISESLLDEFPGIGDARKQALLKRFGSVQRLKLATAEESPKCPASAAPWPRNSRNSSPPEPPRPTPRLRSATRMTGVDVRPRTVQHPRTSHEP